MVSVVSNRGQRFLLALKPNRKQHFIVRGLNLFFPASRGRPCTSRITNHDYPSFVARIVWHRTGPDGLCPIHFQGHCFALHTRRAADSSHSLCDSNEAQQALSHTSCMARMSMNRHGSVACCTAAARSVRFRRTPARHAHANCSIPLGSQFQFVYSFRSRFLFSSDPKFGVVFAPAFRSTPKCNRLFVTGS